jgi:hypothetical protein
MKNPLYSAYGAILMALMSYAQWSGFSLSSINEVRNIPKSVRENPGVYRSHYGYLPRWFGGK